MRQKTETIFIEEKIIENFCKKLKEPETEIINYREKEMTPLTDGENTLIFFYKHNNYKYTYGKKCEKISIILSIMLR